MKFLCLVYAAPGALDVLAPSDKEALDRDSQAYDRKLMAEGGFLAASALQGVGTARCVRVRGGKAAVTDGPFAETKEILVGFIFVEATDMRAAVEIAKGIPMARHGTIEVRPELDFG